MGSLSNLYISQSYISLIHLGSNNTASSTPTELQDGLGNGVGVSVSTNKNLYVSGNVYATNLTGSGGTIDTSSLVTTASFNTYTASQDFKNTTFATTASNTFTGNQTLSGSLFISGNITMVNGTDLITHHVRAQGSNGLELQTSAGTNIVAMGQGGGTQAVFVGAVSANSLSASTINGLGDPLAFSTSVNSRLIAATGSTINTGSFATTGSNSFVGNQTITGSVTISGSSNVDLSVVGQIFVSSSATGGTTQPRITISGSAGTSTINRNSITTINTTDEGGIFPSTLYTKDSATEDEIGFTVDTSVFGITGWSTGPAFYINNTALDTYPAVFGFQNKANYTDGRVAVLTPLSASAGFTASLQDGYAWVGNSLGQNTQVATSSFGGGGGVGGATTGSNTFTGIQTLSDVDLLNQIGLDDHSGSLVLFAKGFTSSSLTHISASSAGIGNIIFKTNNNTPITIVSGSGNIFTNAAAATAGFNRYIGGSGNIMLNASNVPQISSSMTISPTMNNNYFGGNSTTLIMRGPVSSSTYTISANSILGTVSIGSSDANHARGIQSGLTLTGNEIQGTLTLIANKANLSSSLSFTNNILNGALSLNVNSSSVAMSNNNINDGNLTLNNNFFSSSAGVGSVTISGNNIGGASNTITIQGTQPAGTTNGIFLNANTILGGQNTLFVDPTNTTVIGSNAYHSANRTIIGGNNLIISASSLAGDNNTVGSAYFGRYNANDGIRNKTSEIVFAVGTGNSTTRKTGFLIDSGSNTFVEGTLNVSGSSSLTGSLTVTSSNLNINSSGEITASKILLTGLGTTNIQYNQQSTGSVAGQFATSYGKDNLKVYQYQGQPYAFNVNLTANQANAYTGSEFQWGLQVNGSNVSIPGGGGTYFSMVSGSTTGSAGDPGLDKKGLDFLGTAMILDMNADTSFRRRVYVDRGMFVSQSVGGSQTAALTVDGTSANGSRAINATGSVAITGSLNLNGQTTFASLGSNTFTQNQIVSASIYISSNSNTNQLYLPSGSNKQTGLATLDGGNPGTVTVSNTNVTANSIIMLTKQTNNHPNAGPVNVSSKGSGTFTITSNHNGDTDVVAFMIINPS